MRVLSGNEKGRRLAAPPGSGTRPTTARVRRSLFDILTSRYDLSDMLVLDLFAGSGALGLEALSRGAAHAIFVDWSPKACRTLKRNIAALGFDEVSKVVKSGVLEHLAREDKTHLHDADLVFCDPPYEFSDWDRLFELLPTKAIVVAESNRAVGPFPKWVTIRTKVYGDSVVSMFMSEGSEAVEN